MKLLLDTHFLIWLATDADQLTRAERDIIDDSERFVSATSIWELRMKVAGERGRGRSPFQLTPLAAMAFCAGSGIQLIDLHSTDSAIELLVPPRHHDPFDEMLLVHAQQLGARLLTRDRNLLAHPIAYRA